MFQICWAFSRIRGGWWLVTFIIIALPDRTLQKLPTCVKINDKTQNKRLIRKIRNRFVAVENATPVAGLVFSGSWRWK